MSRYLDCAPEMFHFTKLATEQSLGLYGTVRQMYSSYFDSEADVGNIVVDGQNFAVAPECVAMLKAVLFAGCCRIEERAAACKKVFDKCVSATTKEDFLDRLTTMAESDQWVNEIFKAAKEEWK